MKNRLTAVLISYLVICSISEPSLAATVDWTDWQSYVREVGPSYYPSAQGIIGGEVDVTYTGSAWSVFIDCSSSDYWTEPEPTSAPYTGSSLIDNRPECDAIRLDWPASHTVTFSEPVWMPLMAIVSLGSDSEAVTYDFGDGVSFSVLSEGQGFVGDGTYTLGAGSITVNEFNGVIQFDGWVDQISFTSSPGERWHGFTFGLAPAPSAFVISISSTSLSIPTSSNATYTVLSTTNLMTTFTPITNFPGDGTTNTVLIDTDAPQRFYKALEVE